MEFKINMALPKVALYTVKNSKTDNYFTFSHDSNDITGQSLQNYRFTKSVNDLIGNFSFSYVEPDSKLFNRINLLDIVKIYENKSTPEFIGVINNKSVTNDSSSGKKIYTISGQSIESLFEMFTIATDTTAMSLFLNKNANNSSFLDGFYSSHGGTTGILIKELFDYAFEKFVNISNAYSQISSTGIYNMIQACYGGNNFFNINDELKFVLPIASPLLSEGSCNFISYVKRFLPENIYLLYGDIMQDGFPKLTVKLIPFAADDWKLLPIYEIRPIQLLNYTLTKSNESVYTAFISYVEGSSLSSDFYKKVYSENNGYSNATRADNDQIMKYGYRPLFCSFLGFETNSVDQETLDKTNNTLEEKIGNLNKLMKDWYGRLDEFYNGSFSIVSLNGIKNPTIGSRVKIAEAEFFVETAEHSWSYGNPVKITYTCSRGGLYSKDGTFSPIDTIPKEIVTSSVNGVSV